MGRVLKYLKLKVGTVIFGKASGRLEILYWTKNSLTYMFCARGRGGGEMSAVIQCYHSTF